MKSMILKKRKPNRNAEQPAPADARLIPRAGELPGPDFFAFAKQHPAPGFVDLYVHRLKPAVVNIPPPEWPTGKKFPTYCEKVKGSDNRTNQSSFRLRLAAHGPRIRQIPSPASRSATEAHAKPIDLRVLPGVERMGRTSPSA